MKLHMARNIFFIYELSILQKLSILFVGKVKITPFNGSIFLLAPGHFYVVRNHCSVMSWVIWNRVLFVFESGNFCCSGGSGRNCSTRSIRFRPKYSCVVMTFSKTVYFFSFDVCTLQDTYKRRLFLIKFLPYSD